MKAIERPADFDKLPKRFRDYFGQLETQIRSLESMVPVRTPKQGASKLRVVDPMHVGNDGYLLDGTTIEFKLGQHSAIRCRLSQYKHGIVGVELNSPEGGSLCVWPRVSNEIVVATER